MFGRERATWGREGQERGQNVVVRDWAVVESDISHVTDRNSRAAAHIIIIA